MKQTKIAAKKERCSDLKIIYEKAGDDIRKNVLISGLINWQPPYDLYLVNDEIFVNIELAGVAIQDVTLYVGTNHLIIYGTKKPAVMTNEKPDRRGFVFHTLEIAYGRFVRSIDLPVPIEPRKFDYRMENGILTIKWQIQKEHIIPIEEG